MNSSSGNGSHVGTPVELVPRIMGLSPDARYYDEHPERIKNYIDKVANAVLDPDGGHCVVLGLQSVGKTFLIEQFAANTDRYTGLGEQVPLFLIDVSRTDSYIIKNSLNGMRKYVDGLATELNCSKESLCFVTESPEFASALYSFDRSLKIILEVNVYTFVQLTQREQQGVTKIWSSWGVVDANEICLQEDDLAKSLYGILAPKMRRASMYVPDLEFIQDFISYVIEHVADIIYESEEEEDDQAILAPPGIFARALRRICGDLTYSSRRLHFNDDGSQNLEVIFEETLVDMIDLFEAYLSLVVTDDETSSGAMVMFPSLEDFLRTVGTPMPGMNPGSVDPDGDEEETKPLVFKARADLSTSLGAQILGQDDALGAVVDAMEVPAAGIHDRSKPVRSFLFLGPTGVGKTQLALSLAESVTQEPLNVIRLDMSEYAQAHEAAKLMGAPSGYVGHDEGGVLTNAVLANPRSVILLDEVEKAHHRIWDAFLQILDAGRMTDNRGRVIDFTETIIIMTSNLGSKEAAGSSPGFFNSSGQGQRTMEMVERKVEEFFRPEFINRIDELVVFKPLTEDVAHDIVRREIGLVSDRMALNGFKLGKFDDGVVDLLLKKSAFSKYGARDIQRAVLKNISQPLARRILDPSATGKTIKLAVNKANEIVVR